VRVLVADVDDQRAGDLAGRIGGQVIDPGAVTAHECDVYAPCALGGTLNAESIPGLRCRIVAGCANNQLNEPDDAARLRDAGILYAPDFVINSGGVLHAWGKEMLGWSPGIVEERHAGIGDALTAIYERAEADGITTAEAAERIARSRLESA
jgi:leucine dehydrogenase